MWKEQTRKPYPNLKPLEKLMMVPSFHMIHHFIYHENLWFGVQPESLPACHVLSAPARAQYP